MSLRFEISLQPKQQELHDAIWSGKWGWIAGGGSRGGAKSHGFRQTMLDRRLRFAGTTGLIIRRKWKEVDENHVQRYFAEHPILRRWYNKQEHVITLPNHSRLLFGYAENPANEDFVGDIYDFQGHQYMDILVDEAQQFLHRELAFLKTCNRWPGAKDNNGNEGRPTMMLAMNPGGRGHTALKRLFVDRQFEENEHADDYLYVPMRAWDNVEWVRAALKSAGFTVADYYRKWTDTERRNFFLESASDYGRILTSLKGKARAAYLDGDWTAFAGQYFDVWSADDHIAPKKEIEDQLRDWHPRWVSIDWGYEHNTAVYWHAEIDRVTVTYRELVVQHSTPQNTGEMIGKLSRGERITAAYLSPDAFDLSRRKWVSQDTIAEQMGRSFRQAGLPQPMRADNDRVGGAMLMYQLLSSNLWAVSDACPKLIANIPEMQRDDDNKEDVLKINCDETGDGGDDCYDSARYGLKSRLSPRTAPIGERVQERLVNFAKSRNTTVEKMEPTSVALMARKARRLEMPKHHVRHFRPGRFRRAR